MSSILNVSTVSNPPHLRVVTNPPFKKSYYGTGVNVTVSTSNYSTFFTLPTVANTNYLAIFNTCLLCTAGTDAGKSFDQVAYWRFKNIAGTLTIIVPAFGSSYSRDNFTISNNGQIIAVNGTVNTSVDFQFQLNTGNTYSYTYTLDVIQSN